MRLAIVFGLATLGVIAIKPNQAKPANGSLAYRQGMFQQQQAGPPARGFLPQQQQAGPPARGFFPQQQQAGPPARFDDSCPGGLDVILSGQALQDQDDKAGRYIQAGTVNEKPYWMKVSEDQGIWFNTDSGDWWIGPLGDWSLGGEVHSLNPDNDEGLGAPFGGVHSNGPVTNCPTGMSWSFASLVNDEVQWPDGGEDVKVMDSCQECCQLNVILSGIPLQEQDSNAGKYIKAGTINELPYWKQVDPPADVSARLIWGYGSGEWMFGDKANIGTNVGALHAQGDPGTQCPTDLPWMYFGPDQWDDAGEDVKVTA